MFRLIVVVSFLPIVATGKGALIDKDMKNDEVTIAGDLIVSGNADESTTSLEVYGDSIMTGSSYIDGDLQAKGTIFGATINGGNRDVIFIGDSLLIGRGPHSQIHANDDHYGEGIEFGSQLGDVFGTNQDPIWLRRYNTDLNISELRLNLGNDGGIHGPDQFAIGYHDSQNSTWIPQISFLSDGRVGIRTDGLPLQSLDVNGGIRVGNTLTNAIGSIRYNNGDFEGYLEADGGTGTWISFTKDEVRDDQILNLDGQQLSISNGNSVTLPQIPINIWLSGATDPTVSSTDGDYYLNSDSGDVFQFQMGAWSLIGNLTGPAGPIGPQGTQGADGEDGIDGVNGTHGATWLTGSGVPSAQAGQPGDLYLNTSNGDYYMKSLGASWGAPAGNLKGPSGPPGDTSFTQVGAGISYISGNLGIGTETPLATLDVHGDVHVSGSMTLSSPQGDIPTITY